jgi:hypothetical protein
VPAVVAVAAEPDMLPVIVLVTVKPVNVPKLVIFGCAAVGTVNEPAVNAPLTANDDNVPTLVMFGCDAVLNAPVSVVAAIVVALIVPVAPIPPVTTSVPVVVLELAVLAVSVTAALADKLVNAAVPLVLAPILVLLIDPVLDGLRLNVPDPVTLSPPVISTLPVNAPVVAVNGLPSSEITI